MQAVERIVFDTTRFVGEVGGTIITGGAAVEVGDFRYLPDAESRLGREHISESVVVIRGGL